MLQRGDILSIDVSIYFNGFHGDNCKTVTVTAGGQHQQQQHGAGAGDSDDIELAAAGARLIEANELALREAIGICGPNV